MQSHDSLLSSHRALLVILNVLVSSHKNKQYRLDLTVLSLVCYVRTAVRHTSKILPLPHPLVLMQISLLHIQLKEHQRLLKQLQF